MYSKIVFAIPIVSLIYLLQTILFKSIKKRYRIPLIFLAISVLLFDVLVSLYFYTSCYEMSVNYGQEGCLSWIYPTLDFKLMVVLSVLLLTLSLWAMVAGWQKQAFYLIGTLVLYLGVVFRVLIFLQSMRITTISGSVNSAIIFEFFTVIVVYGLVSAFIYASIFLLSFLKPQTLPEYQE